MGGRWTGGVVCWCMAPEIEIEFRRRVGDGDLSFSCYYA